MSIHYRDLQGVDLGVLDTPENEAVMRAAIRWANEHVGRYGITYIWREGGRLYFAGPWLGAWDIEHGVYVLRPLRDPRTSWETPRRPVWTFENFAARILADFETSMEST